MLVASAAPAAAAGQSLVTSVTGLDDYEPAAFQEVRATGATFVQLAVPWYDIAPDVQTPGWQPENPADPHYDWSYLDKGVVNAISAGLTPVLQVDGAPHWAQRCKAPPQGSGGDLCDPDPAALALFAKAAAYRYSGSFAGLPKVLYWQALNEPNLSLFFYPQFVNGKPASPGLYRDLINSFYAAIKSVDPANLVLAGGLGPIAVPGYTIGPMEFTRKLLCMKGREKPRPLKGDCGGGVHFDIFDIHPYTTGAPTHEGGKDDVQMGDLNKLQTLLSAADKAGRIHGKFKKTPLWINEFSWDSNPPDPGGLPMAIETRWVAEALYVAWKAGVSHFSWYSLRDQRPDPSRSFKETLQSGLYFRGPEIGHDHPKEFLYAFRFPFVAYPTDSGVSIWGRTPSSGGGRVNIQLFRGGGWKHALSVKANARGIFTGLIPGRYGRNKKGSARAIFNGESAMPFSMRPVRDFRQPPFG
ncbi:MAG TPA: hypothetical protein VFI03_07380 [Solirubrobacterales bacterium]|nr:hypothetical protein [Solirubrobacterales bacterium]